MERLAQQHVQQPLGQYQQQVHALSLGGQVYTNANGHRNGYIPISPKDENQRKPDLQNGNAAGQEENPRPKKKQKRNKPTLSCEECVERKTKVSDPAAMKILCKILLYCCKVLYFYIGFTIHQVICCAT